jgi:amidohydrolase
MKSYTRDQLVAIRRDLHAKPELRFQEFRTSSCIAELLKADGWSVTTGIAGTGLTAVWNSDYSGPRVLVRADMDAYPVQDSKTVPYVSTSQGVAHACGHDVHMTVVLGLARRLAGMPTAREVVTLMFQPAEEIPFGEESGARAMIDSGLLATTYQAVLGLHCWPQLPVGTVGIDGAASMAAKDAFKITFTGVSAHVATPAHGRDAILAASNAVMALHSSLNRERNSTDLVAFNIGTIGGGRSQSALADHVELTGTLRSHDEAVRTRLKETIRRVCDGAALSIGVTHDILWANEMPILMNAAPLVEAAIRGLPLAGIKTVSIERPPLTSDDFALLGELGPLLYIKLGVADPLQEKAPPLHSSTFDVHEDCIEVGILALETILTHLLETR